MREREGGGDHGEGIARPPWILGHRGSPREAPENTLAGMRRALELGLDGFEYDLRACASGEAVLLHDATLDRTTDARGRLAERSLTELFGIDAGGWFERRYRGEPVPLFDEVLELTGEPGRAHPLHMIELKERGLVEGVAAKLRELAPDLPVRVASFDRPTVLEARDLDLPAMLLAVHADEDDRRFVRDERIGAYATGPGGWRSDAGAADWSFCERWSWSVDEPEDLLAACRTPLFGFNTNEPARAMAVRALVRLAPDWTGPYPVRPPVLELAPERLPRRERERGEWFGAWDTSVAVHNPFPFPVRAACGLFPRGGAFEIEGLPLAFRLTPGEELRVPFRLTGGSRSPGGDPLLAVHYRWREGPGRPLGRLLLDAPVRRLRRLRADPIAQRLAMLAERPEDRPASMTVQRTGGDLLVSVENPGELEQAHAIAHLCGEVLRGGRGLRLRLPRDFDARHEGVPFSCGIEGRRAGERAVRRWAGGVPEGLEQGEPGRLLPLERA